jgi:hypothetical protein
MFDYKSGTFERRLSMTNVEFGPEWVPEPIADFQLQYDRDTRRITSGDPRVGSYLGSGTGEAQGNLLRGKIRWDLFEAQGETLCAANFRGEVETEDGTTVMFDCLGFFRRPEAGQEIWTMSGSVVFLSDDPRHSNLMERPALWEGEFDMSTYTHRYRLYRRKGERAA